MKLVFILASLLSVISSFAQEGVGPLLYNSDLIHLHKNVAKINAGTFDSTFIYTSDTITLPIKDDFAKNKIQKFEVSFTDPSVTSDKKYRVLDMLDVPMSVDYSYTTQVTFRKIFDINTSQTSNVNFAPIQLKVGSLVNYPVVYATTNVYPPYYIFDTVGVANEPDTIWVVGPDIYQDSATQFFAHVVDPTKIWLDDHAYHNYRYAIDPWSLGVMTFDGLDRTGYPYEMGSTLTGPADALTSKPINLSGANLSDSIYISFIVQQRGLGDPTEVNDSLVLEFYDSFANQWIYQWGMKGGVNSDVFEHAHVRIKSTNFLTDDFQFRFRNFGALSGNLDHFHLDYVHFRAFSGFQDTLVEDFAMVYPTATLLKDYTSVPWDHYKNNPAGKMSTATDVVVRNSYLNGGANISSAAGGNIRVSYNAAVEGNIPLNGQVLAGFPGTGPDYSPRTTYHSTHDITPFSYDPSKTGTQQFFDIETSATVVVGSNDVSNDTAYTRQYFGNYYSYDDGTPEQAYFVTGPQAKIAVQYTPYEADSIIGMSVHFVPTVQDASLKLFQMAIWDDNAGAPGNVLYEDNAFMARQPIYVGDRFSFVNYFTQDTMKIPVSGTFYIGWKQIDNAKYNVGMDMNIDNHVHNFYALNNSNTWVNSELKGSLMIRPIFSTSLDPELGVETKKISDPEVLIYPNPSSSVFNVSVSEGEIGKISVYSIQGSLVTDTEESSFNLEQQPSGIYFVKIANSSRTFKVIKN